MLYCNKLYRVKYPRMWSKFVKKKGLPGRSIFWVGVTRVKQFYPQEPQVRYDQKLEPMFWGTLPSSLIFIMFGLRIPDIPTYFFHCYESVSLLNWIATMKLSKSLSNNCKCSWWYWRMCFNKKQTPSFHSDFLVWSLVFIQFLMILSKDIK